MYTGITRGTFKVTALDRSDDLLTYSVAVTPELALGIQIGASVSIDGVCQTVVAIDGNALEFEAIRETLDLTTLGSLELGQKVAVERSSRVGDEVGGHDVAGHVIGTGRIDSVHRIGHVCDLRVAVPRAWMKYILEKGFIAIDGSSLTVGKTDPVGAFDLHLIPETLRLTNLGERAVGDRVNIELDARTVAIVDTVERVLEERRQAEEQS
ncbi:MAG: riboflavin synthase subunit alpha [Deltaproteobacteria bacterium]|nr:riboflavin synthase subunit alpha [Deltaproteobacteria bacterium]